MKIEESNKIENEESEKDNKLKKEMENGRRGEIWRGIRKDSKLKRKKKDTERGKIWN